MFEVGQKVLFTNNSIHDAGLPGVIVEVDEDDLEGLPYLVGYTDKNGFSETEWCDDIEVEADEEVSQI